MTPAAAAALRTAMGTAVLTGVVWLTGWRSFLDGLHAIEPVHLGIAVLLTGVTTLACAWRWTLVARGLGAPLALSAAVPACYRAQLVNLTVPGGVVGDVHRGWRHGQVIGHRGRGLRAVAWERVAGQTVQGVVLLVALVALPNPIRSAAGPVTTAGLVVVVVVVAFLLVRRGAHPTSSRWTHVLREDLRRLRRRGAWPGIVAASLVALTAHVALFVVAAGAVGVSAADIRLVPLALLVLTAAALPLHLVGWGPREGTAVWGFAAAGLGAGTGAATATAYGVLVLAAHLPALALPLLASHRRRSGAEDPRPAGPGPQGRYVDA